MTRCDDIFRAVREGALPSAMFARLANNGPNTLDSLQNLDNPTCSGELRLMDELFMEQRLVFFYLIFLSQLEDSMIFPGRISLPRQPGKRAF